MDPRRGKEKVNERVPSQIHFFRLEQRQTECIVVIKKHVRRNFFVLFPSDVSFLTRFGVVLDLVILCILNAISIDFYVVKCFMCT